MGLTLGHWKKKSVFLLLVVIGIAITVSSVRRANEATRRLEDRLGAIERQNNQTQNKLDAIRSENQAELHSFHDQLGQLIASNMTQPQGQQSPIEIGISENMKTSEQIKAEVQQGPETIRKLSILRSLRREYILSNENIRPGIIAGTDWPPIEWLNERISTLGEKWKVVQLPPNPAFPDNVP
jgi:hypothetical protein